MHDTCTHSLTCIVLTIVLTLPVFNINQRQLTIVYKINMCGHSDYGIYNFLSLQVHICMNNLDDVILTLITMVPKGREGIKDISNTCN
jgi:hypothetical protein